jgi:hypothetical protein
LCSVASDLAVLAMLAAVLGLAGPFEDRMHQYNFYRHTTTTTKLARNGACPVEHLHLERVTAERPLADCTLRECAAAAGVCDDDAFLQTTIDVDGMVYAARVTCPDCGAQKPHHRFMRPGAPTRRHCGDCVETRLAPHPFHAHERLLLRRAAANDLCDTPLRALGAAPACVIVRGPAGASLITHEPENGGQLS